MIKIIEKVIAKRDAMMQDASLCGQNATLAIAALNGGIQSDAWRSYMMQFVEQDPPGTPVEPAQLQRLLATDGTLGDPTLDMRRAYLVGNAICGAGTPDDFDYGVNSIDQTLPDPCPNY
jgi:hypothetical protein